MKYSLIYKDEHQSCTHFKKEDVTFDFKSTEKEREYSNSCSKENLIIVFLKGSFRVTSHFFNDRFINQDEMIVIPQGDNYKISASKNARMLFFKFEKPASSCAKQLLNSYNTVKTKDQYTGIALSVKEPIHAYVELLNIYISAGIKCEHLLEMKKDEFFLSLRWFYTKDELAHFFYPILHCTCSFRQTIMNNLDHTHTVSELIDICNMSKSLFYKRFKNEFGMSAKQWLIAQLKDRIKRKIMDPEITAKELMNEFNFSSPEHLNLFCKKQFGMTPSQLIKSHQIM